MSREHYFVVTPCCDDSSALREFALLWGISLTQIRHITHVRHLRGFEGVTVYLEGEWESMNPRFIIDLYLLHENGLIQLSPQSYVDIIRESLEKIAQEEKEKEHASETV